MSMKTVKMNQFNGNIKDLNPNAPEFHPNYIQVTNPPTFLPTPPELEALATVCKRKIEGKPLQDFIDTYKAVLTFIACHPEDFYNQILQLKDSLSSLPKEIKISKDVLIDMVKMNVELAISEEQFRQQSARVCLSLDSYFNEFGILQATNFMDELTLNYLMERYFEFESKLQSNHPNIGTELCKYSLTLADYFTRLINKDNQPHASLGRALIEVLTEVLNRTKDPKDLESVCFAFKMSCRTIFKVEKLKDSCVKLKNKLRELCAKCNRCDKTYITDDCKIKILTLLEQISYIEGKSDHEQQYDRELKLNIFEDDQSPDETTANYIPMSNIGIYGENPYYQKALPDEPVVNDEDWADFVDEFGNPILSEDKNEIGSLEFEIGCLGDNEIMSPNAGKAYSEFTSKK